MGVAGVQGVWEVLRCRGLGMGGYRQGLCGGGGESQGSVGQF